MSKWLKMAFLSAPLILAGYFFGIICRQIGQAYELIISPSMQLLNLLWWFLLALIAVMVSAGLVAALVRPLWIGMIVFAFSGLALLLGWQLTVGSSILALIYLLAGAAYVVGVARELSQRIRFSVRPITGSQDIIRIAVVLVTCSSLYFNYAPRIEQEGFSIPETYIKMFMEQQERQIASQIPPELRQEAVARFRVEFRHNLNELFERKVKPYERFIPLAVALCLFIALTTITELLSWVPAVVLGLLFPILAALGVTKEVTETQDIHKLIIA